MIKALLTELVRIPSSSGQEQALAAFCEAHLQRIGFQTQRQWLNEQQFNLLAERPPVGAAGKEPAPAVLLYAHLDTVPPDPAWLGDPYGLTEQQGRLLGLGASDMKAGLAILLALAEHCQPRHYGLKLALGVEEETWSSGAWKLVENPWCDDIQLALVPELSVDAPELTLGLGRRGHLALEILLQGPRQHAAVPLASASAIEQAAKLLSSLADFPLKTVADAAEGLVVRGIQSEAAGLTVPAECRIQLSAFLLPTRSAEAFVADLRQYLALHSPGAELQLQPRPTPAPVAYQLSPDHPLVLGLQQAASQVLGKPLPQVMGWSPADENILAQALEIPVLSLAPVGGASHQAGEWVEAASLQLTYDIYLKTLTEMEPLR